MFLSPVIQLNNNPPLLAYELFYSLVYSAGSARVSNKIYCVTFITQNTFITSYLCLLLFTTTIQFFVICHTIFSLHINTMKLRLILSTLTLTTLLLFTSCKHESELLPGTTEVCFETQVLPVLQSGCTMSGCHDGSGELPSLSTYSDIRRFVEPGKPVHSELHKVLTANRLLETAMPPRPKEALTNEQINLITLWILQGANNSSCTTECDTVNVSFTGSILPITNTYCKGCHSGSGPSGGISLTDYNSIKASAESGRLMGAVEHQPGFSAMPQGGNKLSDCNIVQLRKWINTGMQNN